MNNETLIQSASLVVYALVVVFSLITLREAAIHQRDKAVCIVVQSLMLLTVAMALIFMTLQWQYVMNKSWVGVPQAEVVGWIAHDWVNGVTHLAFVLAARVLVHWDLKPHAPCMNSGKCPGRLALAKTSRHSDELAEIRQTLNDRLRSMQPSRVECDAASEEAPDA